METAIGRDDEELTLEICFISVACRSWACVQCHTNYDLNELEQVLVATVHRKSMAFVLQDLKCSKCKMASTSFILRRARKRQGECNRWVLCNLPFLFYCLGVISEHKW